MSDQCQEIRELIGLYIDGNLSEQDTKVVSEHTGGCEQCRAYLEALKRDAGLLSEYVQSMRPAVGRIEKEVIEAIGRRDEETVPVLTASVGWNAWVRYAAAAVLLVGAGFVVGRATGGGAVDVERLKSEIKVSLADEIKKELSQELKGDWQAAFAAGCREVKSEITCDIAESLTACWSDCTGEQGCDLVSCLEKEKRI